MPATNRRDYLREVAAAVLANVATYTGGFAFTEGDVNETASPSGAWKIPNEVFDDGIAEGKRTETGEATVLATVYVKSNTVDTEISRVTELVERAIMNCDRPRAFNNTCTQVTIRSISREIVAQQVTRTANTAHVIIPITITYTQTWKPSA